MRLFFTLLTGLLTVAATAQVSGSDAGSIITVTRNGSTRQITVPPEGRDLIVADFAHRFDTADLLRLDTLVRRFETGYNLTLEVITVSNALLQQHDTKDYTESLWVTYTFGRPDAGQWLMVVLYPDIGRGEIRTLDPHP
jgi:hypothetical protein